MSNYLPAHQHTAACGHIEPPPQAPACAHHSQLPAVSSGGAGKWVGIGAGGSLLVVTLAVGMVAFAISAVALTICLLVLRSMLSGFTGKG